MIYNIAVGGQACREQEADLYIDKYALAEVSMNRIERERELMGAVLEDPTDEVLFEHLERIPQESEVHIYTSMQGRYSLASVPKLTEYLRRRRMQFTIKITQVPEIIRETGRLPKVEIFHDDSEQALLGKKARLVDLAQQGNATAIEQQEELNSIEEQLKIWSGNLRFCEEKAARYSIDMPTSLNNEINYIKSEIETLKKKRRNLLLKWR